MGSGWTPERRARQFLDLAAGLSNEQVAARQRTRAATVSKWRVRFASARLQALEDRTRSGRPTHYDAGTERRILQALDEPSPAGYARWNGTLLSPSTCRGSPSTRSGECCASTGCPLSAGAAGASVPNRTLPRRPPTSWRCILTRRRVPWSGRKAGCKALRQSTRPRTAAIDQPDGVHLWCERHRLVVVFPCGWWERKPGI